ncbi:MAG: hypothetical protein KUG77_07235 [Nannocystaceae bacterium]|nr:hypothetical protein [Nannocystaceae bacterium]
MRRLCPVLGVFVLLACGGVVDSATGGRTSVGEVNTASTGTTATQSSTSAGGTTSTAGSEPVASSGELETSTGQGLGDDESGCAFLCPESTSACSIWAQDCPPGETCTTLDRDGGWSDGQYRCVPLVPGPEPAGAPCARPGPGDIDSCAQGTVCWDTDLDSSEGTCTPLCTGTPSQPSCADPSNFCSINGSGTFSLCFPSCDPLDPAGCSDGRGCYPVLGGFTCAPDASGESGGPFEPCTSDNRCDPGSACADAAQTGLCGAEQDACCTPWCDLNAPDCPPQTQCIPYAEGSALPGFEHVGLCLADPE